MQPHIEETTIVDVSQVVQIKITYRKYLFLLTW